MTVVSDETSSRGPLRLAVSDADFEDRFAALLALKRETPLMWTPSSPRSLPRCVHTARKR